MSPLISAAELASLLDEPTADRAGLVLLDATTLLPGESFDIEAMFIQGHLPGARRFDIEAFSDPDSTLPHMVPSQGRFARLIAALGVGNDSDVMFYDQSGIVSAARGWWLLGLFGHDRARVLDGGLPAWRAWGYRLEQGAPSPPHPAHFTPMMRTTRLIGLGDMVELSRDAVAGRADASRLLDARSRGRFEATAPEPRAGLAGGHIPGAASLPFGELLVEGRHFRPMEDLRARFEAAGVMQGDRVVTSCGSGLTASVLSLGLAVAGYGAGAMYDGSWTEWAQAPGLERATGPGMARVGGVS